MTQMTNQSFFFHSVIMSILITFLIIIIITIKGTFNAWQDCNLQEKDVNVLNSEVMVMGYSARSLQWRYTLWMYFDRKVLVPHWYVCLL